MKNKFRKALHVLIAGVTSLGMVAFGTLYILYYLAQLTYKTLERKRSA